MGKTPQSKEDLEQHLDEQLRFLSRSADAYDAGFTDEAKRLAVTIRILVHDTRNSTSLMTQLNQKTRPFYDTSVPDEAGNLVPYAALTQIAAGIEGATYLPFLDGPLPRGIQPRHVEFEPWWTASIIRTVNENIFSQCATGDDRYLSPKNGAPYGDSGTPRIRCGHAFDALKRRA